MSTTNETAERKRATGLEGVVAAKSAITYVDGAAGELRYRGYSVADLSRSRSFEEVVGLLWDGELPQSGDAVRRELARGRALDDAGRALVSATASSAAPLDVLRTLVSGASARSGFGGDNSPE